MSKNKIYKSIIQNITEFFVAMISFTVSILLLDLVKCYFGLVIILLAVIMYITIMTIIRRIMNKYGDEVKQ